MPFCTHPLVDDSPIASMNTRFWPLKPAEKVSARFSVRLLPETVAEDPIPFKVHWPFDSWPDEPGISPWENPVPVSL